MNIHVGRYAVPTTEDRETAGPDVGFPSDTWEGWVEDDARTWIVFVGVDHKPLVFLNRDTDGGVIS